MVYIGIASALVVLAILIVARWLMARSAILTVEDAITVPGRPADVRVWLERRLFLFIDPNIDGEKVEIEGRGTHPTDIDGIAEWEVRDLDEGLHPIKVRLPGPTRYRAADADGIVAVFKPDDPVLITDIDHTVADCSPVGFITRPNESVRTIPGAPEALRELAKTFRIVYLSARDHIFVGKTRAWLRSNGFPDGPLLLRRLRFTKATPLEHKLARLEEVVAILKNVRYGVGDLPTDVEAYRRRGIRPILLSSKPVPGVPEDVPRAATWNEIVEMVRRA